MPSNWKPEDLKYVMQCEGDNGEHWYLLTKPLRYEPQPESFKLVDEARGELRDALNVSFIKHAIHTVACEVEARPWYLISPRSLFLRSRASAGLRPALARKIMDLLDQMTAQALLGGGDETE